MNNQTASGYFGEDTRSTYWWVDGIKSPIPVTLVESWEHKADQWLLVELPDGRLESVCSATCFLMERDALMCRLATLRKLIDQTERKVKDLNYRENGIWELPG